MGVSSLFFLLLDEVKAWVRRRGSINVTDYGAIGDGSTGNATTNNAAFAAAFTAAQNRSNVDGRVVPIIVPPGHYILSAALAMFDLMQLIGAERGFRNNEGVTIENRTTDMFAWPAGGATQVRMPVIKGINFYGQSQLAGTAAYTVYPFDHTAYGSKTLWYPLIENCSFQYFVSVKVGLLGGSIQGGQIIHSKSTPLYVQGYDYCIGGGGAPLYIGLDPLGGADATVPLVYLENGSNIRVEDIFPTVTTLGRALHIYNVDGIYLFGARLDGYDVGAPTSIPISGAALYLDTCKNAAIIAPRIHGAMGGPAKDGASPTDQGAITLKDSSHVSIVAPTYINMAAAKATIGYVGTVSDVKIAGAVYNTTDGTGLRSDAGGATVTNVLWDEVGTPGPAGPLPFSTPTTWNSGTAYVKQVGSTPASAVVRSGSLYVALANNTNVDPATDGGTNWKLVAQAGAGADYLNTFGDGSDGVVAFDGTNTFSFATKVSNTYTLNRDVMASSMTISAGVTVKPNSYVLRVTGTLTNTGTIDAAGGAGTSAGVAGAAGGSATQSLVSGGAGGAGNTGVGTTGSGGGMGGGNGGAGGLGTAGAGTSGGAVTTTTQRLTRLAGPIPITYGAILDQGTARSIGGGAGGAGGTGDNTNKGGGGGGGGGPIGILAATVVNNGTITANGGAGGTPTTGNAGGGGGGGGGLVAIYTLNAVTGSGTTTANAGAASSGVGTGAAGIIGSVGNVVTKVLA